MKRSAGLAGAPSQPGSLMSFFKKVPTPFNAEVGSEGKVDEGSSSSVKEARSDKGATGSNDLSSNGSVINMTNLQADSGELPSISFPSAKFPDTTHDVREGIVPRNPLTGKSSLLVGGSSKSIGSSGGCSVLGTEEIESLKVGKSTFLKRYIDMYYELVSRYDFPPWLDPMKLKDLSGVPLAHGSRATSTSRGSYFNELGISIPEFAKNASIKPPPGFESHTTPMLRQYWKVKSENFDSILLFKVGKFYELFYVDAGLAQAVCDLKWMGNDGRAHVGFPEISLSYHAAKLVDAGYVCVVVEQVETVEEANDRSKVASGALVERKVCQVISASTVVLNDNYGQTKEVEGAPLKSKSERDSELPNSLNSSLLLGTFIMAVYLEGDSSDGGSSSSVSSSGSFLAVCAVDVVTGEKVVGSVSSLDELNDLISVHVRPREVVLVKSEVKDSKSRGISRSSFDEPAYESPEFVLGSPTASRLDHEQLVVWLTRTHPDLKLSSVCINVNEGSNVKEDSLNVSEDGIQTPQEACALAGLKAYLKKLLVLDQVFPEKVEGDSSVDDEIRDAGGPHQADGTQQIPSVMLSTCSVDGFSRTASKALNSCSSKFCVVDACAATALELFEDSEGRSENSLYGILAQRAFTAMGKRVLSKWIALPIFDDAIVLNDRLDAVETLVNVLGQSQKSSSVTALSETFETVKSLLSSVSDLARSITLIKSYAVSSERKAVFFTNVEQKRIKTFVSTVDELIKCVKVLHKTRQVEAMPKLFLDLIEKVFSSNVKLDGSFSLLEFLCSLKDSFRVDPSSKAYLPNGGVCTAYDALLIEKSRVEAHLDSYLCDLRSSLELSGQALVFVHSKYPFEIEVSERDWPRVKAASEENADGGEIPAQGSKGKRKADSISCSLSATLLSCLEMSSSRKGAVRFRTKRIVELVAELDRIDCGLRDELYPVMAHVFKKLVSKQRVLNSLIECLGSIDAVLAMAHLSAGEGYCRPEFVHAPIGSLEPTGSIDPIVPTGPLGASGPTFFAEELGHPVYSGKRISGRSSSKTGSFVRNNVFLGGSKGSTIYSKGSTSQPSDCHLGGADDGSTLILTGPNMGGKSTLMRSIGVCSLLAQMGCFVPAKSFRVSPFDRIFVRMGARDDLLAGQSTLLVELKEACSVLRFGTCRSLVLMDELGRGTSTSDGMAIAKSVLQDVTSRLGSICVFSTHFHSLVASIEEVKRLGRDDFPSKEVVPASDTPSCWTPFCWTSRCSVKHLEYRISINEQGTESIKFLYRLANGSCDSSQAINVARLAGINERILSMAAKIKDAVSLHRFDSFISSELSSRSIDCSSPVLLTPGKFMNGGPSIHANSLHSSSQDVCMGVPQSNCGFSCLASECVSSHSG